MIDVSRDNAELSKGKEIFKSFKNEIVKVKCIKNKLGLKNKILIVVISTVMTWTNNKKVTIYKNCNTISKLINLIYRLKKGVMNKNDIDNRIPNPDFIDHYEFEQEVLAVNKTEGVNTRSKCIYN